MPRVLKNQRIKEVIDKPSGARAWIEYNRNEGRNWHEATIHGETFHDSDITKVAAWAIRKLRESAALLWQPVINAVMPRYNRHGAYSTEIAAVVLGLERYYVARAQDGYRRARWDLPEEQRAERSEAFFWRADPGVEFSPPCDNRRSTGAYYQRVETPSEFWFPYSDELWAGLVRIRAEIEALHERLRDTLDPRAGVWPALAGAALLALPQPKEEHAEETEG